MKLPRRWWLALPVIGVLASLAAPRIYAIRHIPAEQRAPVQVDASIERDLACAVEKVCGPLRGEVTLTLAVGGEPTAEPVGVLPPGYGACAARVIGTQIDGALRLAPCGAP